MRPNPHPAVLVALLLWAMVAGTIFYPAFAVLASAVIVDLELTPTTYGLFLFVFSATAAALSPWSGRLADRLGGRKALALTFGLTSLGFAALAVSPSLVVLSASSLLVAVGQSTMNPSTNKLIANLTKIGSRGAITGAKQSGVTVGYVVTGLVAPVMAASFGWRSYFVLLAITMAVGLAGALWILPPDRPTVVPGVAPRVPVAPWVHLLAVYGFVMGLGSSSNSFLPLFAETELGFSNAQAGLLASTLGVMAIGTRILGGTLAERHGNYRKLLMIASLTGVLFSVATLASPGMPFLIWPAVLAFSLGFLAWNSIGMLAIIDRVGNSAAGAATGRVLLGFIGGLAIGPVLYGRLIETIGFRITWAVPGGSALVAMLIMRGWQPPPPVDAINDSASSTPR